MKKLYPHEFPRPNFRRFPFQTLDGEYGFSFDDNDIGVKKSWFLNPQFEETIEVPFCYQSDKSTVVDKSYHPIVWYSREFIIEKKLSGSRLLLHFGAIDYHATIWINGNFVGSHSGGYTPFCFEISSYLNNNQTKQLLVIRVEDYFDPAQVRGKQYWKPYNEMCWYQACTGIWQTVWLEKVEDSWIERLACTPDIDNHSVRIDYIINNKHHSVGDVYTLQFTLKYENLVRDSSSYSMDPAYQAGISTKTISEATITISEHINSIVLPVTPIDAIKNTHFWSPETPNLVGLNAQLRKNNEICDTVDTYFGLRKIEVRGNEILLNNQKLKQILVLDQGYWEESLLTPPSSDALKLDIELAKSFGFNGARKHQKIETPHYYYWADVLGFLVWGELPSTYKFSEQSQTAITRDLRDFINRDYNHPCIISWVPLNESWGVRDIGSSKVQQDFARSLYYLTRSLDPTRLIITNDGWEQVNETDFYGIHDYTPNKPMLNKAYYVSQNEILKTSAQKKLLLVSEVEPEEKPLLITEYGGIAFTEDSSSGWGYYGKVKTEKEFLNRFMEITNAFLNLPYVQGICYTQLTDVFQEKNGLTDMQRKPKVNVEKISSILRQNMIEDKKEEIKA